MKPTPEQVERAGDYLGACAFLALPANAAMLKEADDAR